jgi:hypothetical protein
MTDKVRYEDYMVGRTDGKHDTAWKQSRLTDVPYPIDGVWITRAFCPVGFYVAWYGTAGFVTLPRWFQHLDQAEAYARALEEKSK